MNVSYRCVIFLLSFLFLIVSSFAQTDPQSTPTPEKKSAAGLDVDDLKIAMAESSLQVNPSLRTTSDLVTALESTITKHCFGDALRTLTYEGNPTDPDCLARMERLLHLYPESPVGICLRDGFQSDTCLGAFQNQTFAAYSSSSGAANAQDPALKVGLSKSEQNKVASLSATLEDVNTRYQAATTSSEKQNSINDATRLYDHLLGIACRVFAISLEEPADAAHEPYAESAELTEIRRKITRLPPGLRAEHQERMLQKAEEELGQAKGNKERQDFILQKILVIKNPEVNTSVSTEGKLRVRVVLPECFDLVQRAEKIIPNLPSPICHRIGWHSPQCIAALKSWQAYRKQLEAQARKTDPKYATPTPKPLISTF